LAEVLVPRERQPGEARVAATPETVKRLAARGLRFVVEAGAGEAAGFVDHDYQAAGAQVLESGSEALQ